MIKNILILLVFSTCSINAFPDGGAEEGGVRSTRAVSGGIVDRQDARTSGEEEKIGKGTRVLGGIGGAAFGLMSTLIGQAVEDWDGEQIITPMAALVGSGFAIGLIFPKQTIKVTKAVGSAIAFVWGALESCINCCSNSSTTDHVANSHAERERREQAYQYRHATANH